MARLKTSRVASVTRVECYPTLPPTQAARAAVVFHAAFEGTMRDYSAEQSHGVRPVRRQDRLGTGRTKLAVGGVVLHPDHPAGGQRGPHRNHIHANVGHVNHAFIGPEEVAPAKAIEAALIKAERPKVGKVPDAPTDLSPRSPTFKLQGIRTVPRPKPPPPQPE